MVITVEEVDGAAPHFAELRGVEEAGCDSIWLYDHLLFDEPAGLAVRRRYESPAASRSGRGELPRSIV